MPDIRFIRYTAHPGDGDRSHITDLVVLAPGNGAQPTLYTTTGYDGILGTWGIAGNGLTRIASTAHDRPNTAGAPPDLAVIQTATGPALLTGGGKTGPLTLRQIGADGTAGPAQSLGTIGSFPGDLNNMVTITLPGGNQAVYGGLAGVSGIGRLTFSATGTLTGSARTGDNAATHADRVAALTHLRLNGTDYILSAGGADPGVTSWRVQNNGSLVAVDSLAQHDDLWIAAPTALAALTVGGRGFVILASAGSNSLTVMRMANNGDLNVTDHVLDDRHSRFEGVTAMAPVQIGNQAWLVVGGADDGISLFQLLPDGTFLARGHIADTTAMGLANVSAIAAHVTGHVTGGMIEIFVASGSETGVTRLRHDPGPLGDVLRAAAHGQSITAGAGNDILLGSASGDWLSGGAGNDVLIDGAGRDTLTGGPGADVFVLVADGETDVIMDFTPSEDRLDLSRWVMLRDISQLAMVQTATGMTITYRDEVLIIHSAHGGPIRPRDLRHEDLIGLTRIPLDYRDGFDIPPDPPPDPPIPPWRDPPPLPQPPGPPPTPAPGNQDIIGTMRADTLYARPGGSVIFGEGGNDTLHGGAGNDMLYGGDGDDLLYGGAGNDLLDGGRGNDRMEGGPGNDIYIVDAPGDLVIERPGEGFDTVRAWIDYTLPANVEILRLQGSAHLNGTGNDGRNSLVGNAGNNTLRGGAGDDTLTGHGGNDVLIGGMGSDTLVGGAGADVFVFNSVAESPPGQGRRDFINGFTHGEDRIDLSAIDADTTRPGKQGFTFINDTPLSGTAGELRWFTWGNNNYNIVEGDVDGDSRADFQIFINLTPWMAADDFIL